MERNALMDGRQTQTHDLLRQIFAQSFSINLNQIKAVVFPYRFRRLHLISGHLPLLIIMMPKYVFHVWIFTSELLSQ